MEESNQTKPKINPVLDGIEWSVNHFAGETIAKKVFEDRTLEELSALNETELAKWTKGAIDRLDTLVDKETRIQIMEECGRMCAGVNRKPIEEAIAKRKKYKSLDKFLEDEGYDRERNVLYVTYTPQKHGVRCFCLGKGLPKDDTMSPTYCQCSVGFVKKYWEDVLERPVDAELIQSAISGANECKFAVHL